MTSSHAPAATLSGTSSKMCSLCSTATAFSRPVTAPHIMYWGGGTLLIAFPPCTYLTNASAVRMRVKGEIVAERYAKAMEAKAFFMSFLSADCAKIAVENPTPLKIVELPPYTQAIQPWQFGHPYTKRTCLWLKELPLLVPTEIITEGVTPWVNGGCKDAHGNYRRFQGRRERDPINRAKTFPGIAAAMAEQWAGPVTT